MNKLTETTKAKIKEQREQAQEDVMCILDELDPSMVSKVCQVIVDRFNNILED